MIQTDSPFRLPDISFSTKLIDQLEIIKSWKNLSGYDREDSIAYFMRQIGLLYLDYFQYHLDEAQTIATKFTDEFNWAIRAVDLHYVYKLWYRLAQSNDWADLWEVACWGRTNIEAFNSMFGALARKLDAGGIVEYMEERKGRERIDRNLIPKNAPSIHWWWFADYGT